MTAVCDFIWKPERFSNINKKRNKNIDGFDTQSNMFTNNKKFQSIKNYDLGINFIQQEYSDVNQFTSEATLSGDTAVLSRGKWPDNCVNGRISFDSGKKFFYIVSRESEKKIILDGFPLSGMFSYTIRLTEFDLGEVKLCAKRNASLKLEEWPEYDDENSRNVTTEYVSVSDSEAIPATIWPKLVSSSIVETMYSQNIYYWLVFYPFSKFNEDVEIKVFSKDKSFWRRIARNRAGFWEYNNSAEATGETWVLASTNDFLHAVSEAVSSKNVNRMSGEDVTSITELEWGLTYDQSGQTEFIARGLTLHSTDPEENPSVSQFCLNLEK
jgi:hypothetical protein